MRPVLKIRRVPIALRLFLTVLLTTLVITTVSLGVLHWTMQKNFARYVADVEMQKLDHLIENLADVYGVYQDWGNAVQAQILQIEGDAAPDDYDKLSPEEQADKLLPYIQTSLMQDEITQLEYEVKDSYIKLFEAKGKRKDRYSSLAYGNYFIREQEKKLKKKKKGGLANLW